MVDGRGKKREKRGGIEAGRRKIRGKRKREEGRSAGEEEREEKEG